MNSVKHIVWYGQHGPMVAIQYLSGSKAVEVISALIVTCRPTGDGTRHASGHGVIVLFMSLNVGSKFQFCMFCIVDVSSVDN